MASRKEQKEQARAARLAKEQELASKSQRNRRLATFGGIIAVVVIVLVVGIVISTGGGGSNNSNPASPQANSTAKAVETMFKGIPQSGATLGNPKAKVTLQYFGDLECPICRGFTLYSFPTFLQDYVRTGKVKVEYKSFCTATCNNTSNGNPQELFDKQQVAALAAGSQNKFWQYTDLFYRLQGEEDTAYVTESYLTGLAKAVSRASGLNVTQWQTDRGDSTLKAQIPADNSLAEKYGVQGTPTLVMLGPKKATEVANSGVTGGGEPYDVSSPTDLANAYKAVS